MTTNVAVGVTARVAAGVSVRAAVRAAARAAIRAAARADAKTAARNKLMRLRLAGPDRGTGTGPDRTDFSAVQSQSKRPDHETVSIFGPDRTETFVAQAFINKLG